MGDPKPIRRVTSAAVSPRYAAALFALAVLSAPSAGCIEVVRQQPSAPASSEPLFENAAPSGADAPSGSERTDRDGALDTPPVGDTPIDSTGLGATDDRADRDDATGPPNADDLGTSTEVPDGAGCVPSCVEQLCGGDGCGGSCGSCGDGQLCQAGACVATGCTAGATRCAGDTVELCDDAGAFQLFLACHELGQTCSEGLCVEAEGDVELPVDGAAAACGGPCVGSGSDALACALDVCDPQALLGVDTKSPTGDELDGAFYAANQYGEPGNDLSAVEGASFLVVGSGDITAANHQSKLPGGSPAVDPYGTETDVINDAVEVRFTLRAPDDAVGFSVDSLFLSLQYGQASGASYIDKFYMVLDAPLSTGGASWVINFGACSQPETHYDFWGQDTPWCFIDTHSAMSESCAAPETDLSGSGFECAAGGGTTGWMRTFWPIEPGEMFTLTFHVHDSGDELYDSVALVDNFQWLTSTFSVGTVNLM